MQKTEFLPCIPTRGTKVPSNSDWIHEVKQDGFRLIVSRGGDRVRLFTRNGHDWTDRYPLIVETARRIRSKQFVLDGEAVLLDLQGLSDFDGLMARQNDEEVQLYAFDILALDGDDLRKLPLHLRKTNLQRLCGFSLHSAGWIARPPGNVRMEGRFHATSDPAAGCPGPHGERHGQRPR